MTKRWLAVTAVLCLVCCGCIEGEYTYTVNPDGSGKVQFDILAPEGAALSSGLGGGGGPAKPEDSLEVKKRHFVRLVLAGAKGVTAWQDVDAEYAADGRVRFTGTAYFKNLDDFDLEGLAAGRYTLSREKDGSLKLVPQKDSPAAVAADGPGGPKKPLPDPTRLTDKELDEAILRQRAEFQTAKPILTGMLTDMKVKYVVRLPGETSDIKVFQTVGKKAVSNTIDGNEILKSVKETLARDNDFFRKQIRESKSMSVLDPKSPGFAGLNLDAATATVARPGGAQFDYQKETQAAREAYPALRKKFDLDDTFMLPMKDEDAKKKPSPPPDKPEVQPR